MKRTQKEILNYIKEEKFMVVAFEKGYRSSSAVGVDTLEALELTAMHLGEDRQVIIVAETSIGSIDRINNEITKYEQKFSQRIPYICLKKYACKYNASLERWEPIFK